MAEPGKTKEVAIRISSAEYPLSIAWNSTDEAQLLVDGKATSLKGSGTTQIANPQSPIKLRLFLSKGVELPKEFAIDQNFPNPFNPTTAIKYQIPVSSNVTLRIFNIMGEEIKTLVNAIQDPGYKSIEWNSTNNAGNPVASGIYFYRIDAVDVNNSANSFVQVKKMLLLK